MLRNEVCMEKRYGKPLGDLIGIKSDFFEQNEKMLEMADGMAEALLAQPRRENCKMCGTPLPGEALFKSHKMDYYLCPVCHHLNSGHQDTEAFANKVYIQDNYAYNYTAKDRENYKKRLEMIYVPKAKFLLETLEKDHVSKDEIKLLDDGAGSGYFVRAMQSLGISATGIEISEDQVAFANKMAEREILQQIDSDKITEYIRKTDANVISAIGVMEHIISLHETLDAIRDNQNIQYLYLSVPMFSFSAVFEAAHQTCYNRHLGGTHTHLFSDESLQYMADQIGFEIAGSWKFGSDIMDLYRFLCVTLEQNGNPACKEYFSEKFLPLIDQLQMVVDQSEFASEVHMVLKRK